MFRQVFLVFSCLVLYTASEPIKDMYHYSRNITQLKHFLDPLKTNQINCSNSFIQMIDFTHISNLHETVQDTFCQISKALNKCTCASSEMKKLQTLFNDMKGNASCTLSTKEPAINMERFLDNVKSYINSVDTLRQRALSQGEDVA